MNGEDQGLRFFELAAASIMGVLGQSIYHYNNALGFFTNALAAIEQRNFDPVLLNDLMYPIPELIKFYQAFRRIAEQIIQRQARNRGMDSAAAIQRAMLPKSSRAISPKASSTSSPT